MDFTPKARPRSEKRNVGDSYRNDGCLLLHPQGNRERQLYAVIASKIPIMGGLALGLQRREQLITPLLTGIEDYAFTRLIITNKILSSL